MFSLTFESRMHVVQICEVVERTHCFHPSSDTASLVQEVCFMATTYDTDVGDFDFNLLKIRNISLCLCLSHTHTHTHIHTLTHKVQ